MNDDRLHDLLIEVLAGNVNISDNQSDFDDWKFLKGRTKSDVDILKRFFRFLSRNYKTP